MSITDAAAAILPIFALILLGAVFRRGGFPGDDFWRPAERVTYYVFFPALLITTLTGVDLGALDVGPMFGALLGGIAGAALLAIATAPLLRLDGPGFTSHFQGTIRTNTYIALSVAMTLRAEPGAAAAAVAIAAYVPTVNILSIIVLSRYGRERAPIGRALGLGLITNPLVLGGVQPGFVMRRLLSGFRRGRLCCAGGSAFAGSTGCPQGSSACRDGAHESELPS
jgi:malonate transporter